MRQRKRTKVAVSKKMMELERRPEDEEEKADLVMARRTISTMPDQAWPAMTAWAQERYWVEIGPTVVGIKWVK